MVQAWEGWDLIVPGLTIALVCVRRLAPWLVLSALLSVEWYDRARDISSEPFGVAMGLYTVACMRGRRETVLAGTIAFGVLVASVPALHRTVRGFWICLIVYAFGLAAGVAVRRIEAQRWRERRLLAEVLVERRVVRRAEERAALAREVHDVCSNSLAVIARLAEVLRLRAHDDPTAAHELLDAIERAARDGMAEVRRFVHLSEGASTDGDLEQLFARVRATGVPLTSSVTGEATDARVRAVVHRVVQEALTNAIRHARPTCVEVRVRFQSDGGASLQVVNDGLPTVPPRRRGTVGGGRGVRGMQERVTGVGGTLRTMVDVDAGTWSVEAVVPGSSALTASHARSTGEA